MTPRQAPLLAALVVALAVPALAGEPKPATAVKPGTATAAKKPAKPPVPIHLWADRVRYQQQKHRAMAKGNVTIIQGDFRIDCDEIEATLDPKTNDFKTITAIGHVRMHTVKPLKASAAAKPVDRPNLEPLPDGRSASCDRAVYDTTTEIIVLEGSPGNQPTVQFGNDRARGDSITYNRREDQIVIDGDTKVTALIPASATSLTSPPGKKPGTALPPGKKPATAQPPR
jgi:lipopolysaccharide transport protein LptA